ncbi:MAG: anaerobic ribonucleoside-triphosphate reductase activating protein [Erysipelotrichaceae bacterium]|nr:anaerobic ribonucleoside-triphosphate reductase activating protein [Erysipelotrichaceae bacterium]
MNYQNDFLINISALYRYTQRYFDKNMAAFNIGSGQMIFLLLIYEHEGIAMQQLTDMADIDKGTTTKSIKKLVDEGYVEIRVDESDKRVKRLYTTKKATGIINDLYGFRNEFVNQLMKNLDEETIEREMRVMDTITRNAKEIVPDESYSQIKIAGLQKLTLLDYPGQVACTIFTAGCNMKCPFCHNRDLVFIPENFVPEDPDDIIEFLNKRKGIIDAVCITGGEPLLQAGLLDFLKQVKELGYKVKVDTNGLFPDRLKKIVESGYVDYVAMDIKNSIGKYGFTTGVSENDNLTKQIRKSINYLLSDVIDYEFRTTVVREFHSKEDLVEAARMIKGAKNYYLQQFVDSGRCIEAGFTAYSREEMLELQREVQKIIPNVQLRGV